MIELLTDRLRIRDHQPEDLKDMHRLFSDPIAMRYLPELQTTKIEETWTSLQEAMYPLECPSRTKWFFVVTDRGTGGYLGEIGYTVLTESPLGKVANLGYFYLPDCWGKGIATEAAAAVLRFAFTEAGVYKLETGCLRENIASEKVMKKLGMVREAELVAHTLHEGTLKDRVAYRMLREEWEKRQTLSPSKRERNPGTIPAQRNILQREPTRLPKAILFDYGQTLIDEVGFNPLEGTAAVLQEAVENPEGFSAEAVQSLADVLLHEIGRRGVPPEAQHPLEFHNHLFYQFLYESLGMQFTKPLAEVERIFWDTAAPGRPAEGMEELLRYLSGKGIRTGVISNISFSGHALKERIERLYPTHRFDCILASSEYLFRKPHGRIFGLALRKLGVRAEDAWYCGDHAYFDVHGATLAGLFPVWYTGCHPHDNGAAIPGFSGNLPVDPCLKITDWSQLPPLLDRLPGPKPASA